MPYISSFTPPPLPLSWVSHASTVPPDPKPLAPEISEPILISPESTKFPDGLSIDPKWFNHFRNEVNPKNEAHIAKVLEAFKERIPVTDISIYPSGDHGEIDIPKQGLKVIFYFEPTGRMHLPRGALTFMSVIQRNKNEFTVRMGDATLGRDDDWNSYITYPECLVVKNVTAGEYGPLLIKPAELCGQREHLNFDQRRIFARAIRGLTGGNAVIDTWQNSNEMSGGVTLCESGNKVRYEYAWHRAAMDRHQFINHCIITNISVYGPGGELLCYRSTD
jgi:hypothetical protein